MTQQEKLDRMREIFDTCLKIAEAKGHDYSGDEDALGNLNDFGWKGVVVRLGDKYHRLKNFCKQGTLKVKDESIHDTLMDLVNYATFAVMMYDDEKRGIDAAIAEEITELRDKGVVV